MWNFIVEFLHIGAVKMLDIKYGCSMSNIRKHVICRYKYGPFILAFLHTGAVKVYNNCFFFIHHGRMKHFNVTYFIRNVGLIYSLLLLIPLF